MRSSVTAYTSSLSSRVFAPLLFAAVFTVSAPPVFGQSNATPIATTGPIVGDTVTLIWTAAGGADGYHIRVQDSAGGVVDRTLTLVDADCAASSICRVTLNTSDMSGGETSWTVQALQGGVAGARSSPQVFVLARAKETRLTEAATNTAVGQAALLAGGGTGNTASGVSALERNSSGNYNTADGMNALERNTTGSWNTALGMGALRQNTTGAVNVAVGVFALGLNTTGTWNTAVGTSALQRNIASSNTAVGGETLAANTEGTGNTAIGAAALSTNTTGNYNFAAGLGALSENTSAGWNTAIGTSAMRRNSTGTFNVAIGGQTLYNNVSGNQNTAVGTNSLAANTANENTAVGSSAGTALTSGSRNTVIGANAALAATTGVRNVAVGFDAIKAQTNASFNMAIGAGTLGANITGCCNVVIGDSAGAALTSSSNVVIGDLAGGNLTTGGNNIVIKSNGVAADANTTRIGTNQTRAFVAGIRGRTTDVADAVAVLIDSAGQLGTVSSSRRYKDDIQTMGAASSPLFSLRPVTFRYTRPYADGARPLDFGLIAEEVAEVMPALVVRNDEGQPETVKYHLLPTLLLNEVQRLERDKRAQADRIETLEREMKDLRALVDALAAAKR